LCIKTIEENCEHHQALELSSGHQKSLFAVKIKAKV